MKIEQIKVKCDLCGKTESMEIEWENIKFPKGWHHRTRSWREDNKPSEIQIVCSDECHGKI